MSSAPLALYIVTSSAPGSFDLLSINIGVATIVRLRWRISASLNLTEESVMLGHSTGHAGPLAPGGVATLIENTHPTSDVWLLIEIDAALENASTRVEAYLSIEEVVGGGATRIQVLGRTAWPVELRGVERPRR